MNTSANILKSPRLLINLKRYTNRENRFSYEIDEAFIYHYEKSVWMHPKKSCAHMKHTRIELPNYLDTTIKKFLKSADFVKKNSIPFAEFLWKRQADPPIKEAVAKLINVERNLQVRGSITKPKTEEDYTVVDSKILQKAAFRDVLKWTKIDYDKGLCLTYLHARGPPDYASLLRVLKEIKDKVPDFSPQTVCDFGSGVGTVFWAVDTLWQGECEDLLCIDANEDMNELNKNILDKCKDDMSIPGSIRWDYYLSSSNLVKYDLVVCSRSMLEVNETAERCTISDLLWQKVKDDGFLVIVEAGSFQSYKAILECREFLLEFYLRRSKETLPKMQVFAPCSHENMCPQYIHEKACYFTAKLQREKNNNLVDGFSYLVLRKQHKTTPYLPRIVKKMKRTGHTIFITCSSDGNLQEIVYTKSKNIFAEKHLMKNLQKGDHLPARVTEDKFIYKKDPQNSYKYFEENFNEDDNSD